MPHNQRGFTLLEWLISLSIGLFLLTFSSQLYINLYRTKLQMEAAFKIHENAQIAFRFLTRDIRMSGFIGCPHFSEIVIPESPYVFKHSLIGWSEGDKRALPFSLQKLPYTSDILCLQYADPDREAILYAEGNIIQFPNQSNFTPKGILLISDCAHAETLQLENAQLKHSYKEDATISRFYRIAYYVGSTHRKTHTGKPIYALYRKDLNTPDQPIELVENIEKLEVLYGVPDKEKTLQHVTQNQVKDWEEVRSVTLTLHFTSTNDATQSTTLAKPERLNQKTQQTVMIRSRRID